jgi:putative ABC transport system substrate-binding protein
MELLKHVAPAARRLAFLGNEMIQPEMVFFKTMEQSAPRLGVTVTFFDAKGPADYEAAFAAMLRERVEGVVVAPNLINVENRKAIADLAATAHLPAVYQAREFPEAGGLISYGIDRPKFFRRAALFVDKIIRGARPGDLPIEQPTQFELVINMKAARALGLSIPASLRVQADRIVE